jgi:hypothetical protein
MRRGRLAKARRARSGPFEDGCDGQRKTLVESLVEFNEERVGGPAALKQHEDDAAATGAVGKFAVVLHSGIALNGGSLGGEPPGALGDLRLETAAADRAGAAAVGREEHQGAGLSIA